MSTFALFFLLAVTTVDVGVVSIPLSDEVRVSLTLGARGELRREGTVSRIKIDVDRIAGPSTLGPSYNTYVVWAISPEGVLDNLGEMELRGARAQFTATTRFTEFGILVSAEPHYMVDRPSSAVVYRSQSPDTDIRRKTVQVETGVHDYSQLKPISIATVHNAVSQARAAFQIAQSVGADRLAAADFRNAQVAIGALEELVSRGAPIDALWPTLHDAIRWSQRAATTARGKR
jgi:hypothetical protein